MPGNNKDLLNNCDIAFLGQKYGITSDNLRNYFCQRNRNVSSLHIAAGSVDRVTTCGSSMLHHITNFLRPTCVKCESGSTVQAKNDKRLKQMQQVTAINAEIEQFIESESCMDRLKRFLTSDFEKDEMSFQLEFAKTAVRQITIIGLLFGAIKGAKEGREGFLMRNQTTMYVQKRSANKKYYNTIVKCMLKESLKYATKAFCFIFPVMAVERCLTVYRNKSSPLHMMAGTAVYGMLAKFFLGPKGMFAGAVIGGVLGLGAGVMYEVVIVWLAGETQEKANYNSVRMMVEKRWRDRGQLSFDEDS